MQEFFILNGFVFTKKTDFFSTMREIYGWGSIKYKFIYDRFEKQFHKNSNIIFDDDVEWKRFKSLIALFAPLDKELKNRYNTSIFFLDYLNTYRGLRHSKGLPVRGQRTWTNAKSTYRANLSLRNYKIDLARRLYGNLPTSTLSTLYLAEQVNFLWKLQFRKEWGEARGRRLKITHKVYNTIFKIDLNALAKGYVDGFSKKNTSRKKNQEKKNTFTLGFEPNFVKHYLDPVKSDKEKVKYALIYTEEAPKIKSLSKKKIIIKSTKKKIIKKKNINWE